MMDAITNNIMTILSFTIGGVSLVSIICSVIWVLRQVVKVRKDGKLTKESIEAAFKEAVLPKTVKLDISNKIEEPIRLGFEKISAQVTSRLANLESEIVIALKILAKLTHANALSEEDKDTLDRILNDVSISEEI